MQPDASFQDGSTIISERNRNMQSKICCIQLSARASCSVSSVCYFYPRQSTRPTVGRVLPSSNEPRKCLDEENPALVWLTRLSVTSINRSIWFYQNYWHAYVGHSPGPTATEWSCRSCSSTTVMEWKNATLLILVVSVIPRREWQHDASSRMLRINRLIILQVSLSQKVLQGNKGHRLT